MLVLLGANEPIRAQGHNAAALSPDHRYVALTVPGEAECSFLYVLKVAGLRTKPMGTNIFGARFEFIRGIMNPRATTRSPEHYSMSFESFRTSRWRTTPCEIDAGRTAQPVRTAVRTRSRTFRRPRPSSVRRPGRRRRPGATGRVSPASSSSRARLARSSKGRRSASRSGFLPCG